MIAVRMRDENMRHSLPTDGIEQRAGVHLIIRSPIDNRNLTVSDDITPRPRQGEGRRIVAQDAAHARNNFLDNTRRERKVPIKRDILFLVLNAQGSNQLLYENA